MTRTRPDVGTVATTLGPAGAVRVVKFTLTVPARGVPIGAAGALSAPTSPATAGSAPVGPVEAVGPGWPPGARTPIVLLQDTYDVHGYWCTSTYSGSPTIRNGIRAERVTFNHIFVDSIDTP